jgi:protein SCO1
MKKSSRSQINTRLHWVLGFLGIVLLGGVGFSVWQNYAGQRTARAFERQSLGNADDAAAQAGGGFALTNQDGKSVTEKTFAGKLLLATFGFTYCPDVCPTKLQDMSLALDMLGADAAWVQPLFISIDPQRDTPAQMKNYVSLYQHGMQGLTGTPAQIAAVAKTFHVYYKRGENVGDGNYMMDHSTAIYLLDDTGKVLGLFGDEVSAEALAAAMKAQIGKH